MKLHHLLAIVLALTAGRLHAVTSHTTYSGEIGDRPVCAVLEFRDDNTVRGAYLRADEFRSPEGIPFPLTRLDGSNPRTGVIELKATLQGQSLGDISLHKRMAVQADFNNRDLVGKQVVWEGTLQTAAGPQVVKLYRRDSENVPALINEVTDAQHRAWMQEPFVRAHIGLHFSRFKLPPDWQHELPWLRYRCGWENIFSLSLLPVCGCKGYCIESEEESWMCDGVIMGRGTGTVKIRLRLKTSGEWADQHVGAPKILQRGAAPIIELPWDSSRDGDFPALPPQGQLGVWVDASLDVQGISFGETVFIEEQVRLAPNGRLELKGRLWGEINPTGEPGQGKVDQQRGPSDLFIMRPATLSTFATTVHWNKLLGFNLGPDSAGEGGVAMASLPKRSAPQQSNSRETEWIDVSADEYLRHEKGENSRRIHLCVPDGKADASGIHVFRNHPEFYLPWTCISNLPG